MTNMCKTTTIPVCGFVSTSSGLSFCIWPIPASCRHCPTYNNEGLLELKNIQIVHG